MSEDAVNLHMAGQAALVGALESVETLMKYVGEPADGRAGLRETPFRVVKALETMTSGYSVDPASILKVFDDGAEQVNSLVVVKDIPVWSMCEHHMLPFFGVAHIGYLPNGRIVGLSKFKRLTDVFARRLQVQERLTQQIADAIDEHVGPHGVGVVLECRHTCMESRGVSTAGSVTITSALRGCVLDEPDCRSEFLALARTGRHL